VKKTTIYLPDELKEGVEAVARREKRSEADVIRDAISAAVQSRRPEPRLPLPDVKLGDPTIAERVDELLDGFGE
jgi:Arc/MetJ-type ribon-helix-helix transcriptional regulator